MQHKVLPPCSPHRVGTRIREGCLFFEKRHPSLTPSQRKFFIASEQLEELQCLPIAPLACGKAAFTPAIRLGVLLSSAAALPISRWYSLISVYRSTPQCGERSNAAFGRQSAAVLTSHAPHGSKARVQPVTTRRDSWRSHVHRTHTAQRVQPFKLQTANAGDRGALPSRSLGGPRGDILSRERISPFPRAAPSALLPCGTSAAKRFAPVRKSKFF